jgi:hypothetical protein
MERAVFTAVTALIAIGVGIPQDLPPSLLLLSRVKRHIKEELQRLPNAQPDLGRDGGWRR